MKNLRIRFVILCIILVLCISGCSEKQQALTVDELISLGEKFLLDLNYEQALIQFNRVIEIEPMNARGYTGAAEAYIGLDKDDDAIAILRQGLDLTGNDNISEMYNKLTSVSSEKPEYSQSEQPTKSESVKDYESNYIIEWIDPTFEALIRKAIDKPQGDIWQSELDSISIIGWYGDTHLVVWDSSSSIDTHANINVLGSLGYFDSDFNWVYYDDGGYKIDDDDVVYKRGTVSNLEDIKHFRNLRKLAICCTSISDISPLSELHKLWDLNLNMNLICDLTPLSNLNLEFLYLFHNPIADWSPVANVPNLSGVAEEE